MEYELINPSDPYTFVADDFETAVLTVFLLGTIYGAKPKDGGEAVPIFLFGGAQEWFCEKFGRTADEGLAAKKEKVATALDSFVLGHFKERKRYETALAAITDLTKREEFVNVWQDGRSSLNDIGTKAHLLAERLWKNLDEGE